MAITAFRGMNPWPQLIFATFVILISFFVFSIVGVITVIPFVGAENFMDIFLAGTFESPEAIALLKYIQVVQSIGLFVVPPFVIAYLYEGKVSEYLNLDKGFSTKVFILVLLAILVILPFIGFVGEWNSQIKLPGFMAGFEHWMHQMEENTAIMIEKFIQVETLGGLLFNIFMIAIIPALGEEFLFRGVIQKIFTNISRNYHWGIWISAAIFSAFHMQFLGFIPRMLLGALFGYMLVWGHSMWLPVLGHFINNLIGVLALHAQNLENENSSQIGDFVENMPVHWGLALFSLMLTILLMIALKNERTSLSGNSRPPEDRTKTHNKIKG